MLDQMAVLAAGRWQQLRRGRQLVNRPHDLTART
jgi:hypothetical protein